MSATDPSRLPGVFWPLLFLLAGASTLAAAQLAHGAHVKQTPIPVEDGSARLVEHYHPAQLLHLTLGLRHPHPDEEQKFLKDLETKGSPEFQHFLSPEEWTRRFGPSQQDEQAVVDWAKSQGLTITHRFPNRLVVDVEGSVSTIEKAFHIAINLYELGGKSFFSTDRDPEIPSHLSGIIQSVGGLNNLQVLRPAGKSTEPRFPSHAPGPGAASGARASHTGDYANYAQAIEATERRRDPASTMTTGAYETNGLRQFERRSKPLDNPDVTRTIDCHRHRAGSKPAGERYGGPPPASILSS